MKKEITISYNEFLHKEELSNSNMVLVNKAFDALTRAYAPYSKFKVGAAIQLENGQVVLGSNQENIAYPSGLCAERVALFAASTNFPGVAVEKMAVVVRSEVGSVNGVISPCGACRQVMNEYQRKQGKPFQTILGSDDGVYIEFNDVNDLLPFAFQTDVI